MGSRISLEALAVLGIFAVVLAAALLVPFWHFSPVVAFSSTSLFLEEYNTRAFEGEEACVKLGFHIPENILMQDVTLRVFNGGRQLFFERFDVPGRDFSKEVCFDSGSLDLGDNRVEAIAMGKNLFFHVEKVGGTRPPGNRPSIEIISIENNFVSFSVKDFDTGFVRPVKILVNGKIDHQIFPSEENQVFSERVEMEAGLNNVSIFLDGAVDTSEFEKEALPKLPFPLGIALLVLAFTVFAMAFFPQQSLVEKIGLSMALTFVLLIALVFTLNYIGFLNFYSVVGLFTAAVLLAIVLFHENIAASFKKTRIEKPSLLLAAAICLFFLVPVLFHLFSFTEVTYWNQFYERQTSLIVEGNAIPTWDNLAYFGRSFSFSPGYFVLEAGVSWVTGLESQQLFAAMLALSNIFLFFSIAFLGKALSLSNKKIALFSLFVAMSGFLLSAMNYSPRHVFSFALFLFALAFTLKHNRPAIAGLMLAAMAFIQFPLLIFFPFFYLIIAKEIKLKRLAKTFGFALIFTLFLMLPNLILYGLPFQASPEDWGYLINYSLYYWFIDIVALLAFFVLFSLTDLVKGKALKDFYPKKLLAGFVLGTLIQLFIIYRWNILTTTTLALFITVILPDKALKDAVSERLLVILALVTFGFLLFGMSYLNVHEIVTTPLSYVAGNTSTSAKILSDPMFGHDISSVAERPVLADLRVEYADEEKLNDAYRFLEEKDYSILKKYGIDYTFNQVDYVHKQAIGGQPKYGIIEFFPHDKVYSNGFIFVHRIRKESRE